MNLQKNLAEYVTDRLSLACQCADDKYFDDLDRVQCHSHYVSQVYHHEHQLGRARIFITS